MEMEYWALVMFAVAVMLLMVGFPVAFTLGAIAMAFGGYFLGWQEFQLLPMRVWGVMTNFSLLAVPLFVFMGVILERSGMAEELLETVERMMGQLRGGMAIAIVLVGAVLAATTGVVGATVVAMGVIALPVMLNNGYDKGLATGIIASSGTLGQIIPPSIILILLADVMGVATGELFAAAVVPGLLLVLIFMIYVLIIAFLRPEKVPTSEVKEDMPGLTGKVVKNLLPLLLLVVAVLGSIFFGIASPTESAAVGALGTMLLAAMHRRMSFANLRDSSRQTARLTSMVFMVLIGATAFGLVFRSMGGDIVVEDVMTAMPGGKWGFIGASMLLIFLLGFFLDFLEICFIVVPILAPIAELLGVNLLWFAILIAMNLQTSFLTPPFGFSLFYLKSVAPPSVRIQDIYRGVIPFIALQVLVLGLIMIFPEVVQWLPALMSE